MTDDPFADVPADVPEPPAPVSKVETDGRLGSRGGSTESLEEGQALMEQHKVTESEVVRRFILRTAYGKAEFHADDAADLDTTSPNLIGAQVNALAKLGLLEKLNKQGQPEHRKGTSKASHGRASYVWRLTQRGYDEARKLIR